VGTFINFNLLFCSKEILDARECPAA